MSSGLLEYGKHAAHLVSVQVVSGVGKAVNGRVSQELSLSTPNFFLSF